MIQLLRNISTIKYIRFMARSARYITHSVSYLLDFLVATGNDTAKLALGFIPVISFLLCHPRM